MDVPPAPLPDDAHSASLPRRDEIEETERSATDVWRNVTRFVGGAAAAATTYIGGGGLASLNDECADPSSSEEELNRLYALELDWLASVREGDNVDINTRYHDASTSESYVWKLARVYKIEWKTTTVHEVARKPGVKLPLRLVVALEACGTTYDVDLTRPDQRKWLAPPYTHTVYTHTLGKLVVGDAVELKVARIGYLPAIISHIHVDLPAVYLKLYWDPPDGFCSININDPKQRGWVRLHPAASAAASASISSRSADIKCVPRVDDAIKRDTVAIEGEGDTAVPPHLMPGQFIVERSDKDGGHTRYVVDVRASDTVVDVKQKLREQDDTIVPEQYHLMNAGRVLYNERLFSDYNVNPNSRIRLMENADVEETMVVRIHLQRHAGYREQEVCAFFSEMSSLCVM